MKIDKTVVIIRGLPGSGKSTLAAQIAVERGFPPPRAADDYFTDPEGRYTFNPALLGAAHAACQKGIADDLRAVGAAIVTNTFTQGWEFQPYVNIAAAEAAVIEVIDLFDGGLSDDALAARNVHGVPTSTIAAMRGRWEKDWRAGDPRPPWARK